jgi:hypothetical protein
VSRTLISLCSKSLTGLLLIARRAFDGNISEYGQRVQTPRML